MAKAKPINAFAVAQTKPTAASKPQKEVAVAEAVRSIDGQEIYSQNVVSEAINNFALGKERMDEGKTLMETTRPVILASGLQHYADLWCQLERKPENIKIANDPTGDGVIMGVTFVNSQINLNPDEFAALANLVGAEQAKALVEDTKIFTLKPDTLEAEISIKDATGKLVKKPVMEHMADMLGVLFADHPAVLANLFEMKPVFRTKKDALHDALKLVGKKPSDPTTPFDIQKYIKAIKTTIQLKPTGNPKPLKPVPAGKVNPFASATSK